MRRPAISCVSTLVALLVGASVEAQPYKIGVHWYVPTSQSETIQAAFNSPDGGITTGSYRGMVRLVVSGSGVSCTPATNDAFYIHVWLSGCSNPNVVPQHDPNWYQLTFDTKTLVPLASARDAKRFIYYDVDAGAEVLSRPYVPAYRTDHAYSFIIDTGLTAADPLHFGVSDGSFGDNSGSYQIEVTQLQQVLSPLADLLPNTSAGWPTPIVISRIPGGHADGPIYAGDTLYVDGAYRNAGYSATSPFQIAWYVDGVSASMTTASAMAAQTAFLVHDAQLGPLSVGWHTVKMVLDSGGAVEEFDETNNEYMRNIYVSIRPPTPGDFTGDFRTEVTVFRPSTGMWYARGLFQYLFGWIGDIPVTADYDGDGRIDIAVFRPSTGVWYIVESGTWADVTYRWGGPGDIPVPGDYNGNGKADIAVFRPSTGIWYVPGLLPYLLGGEGDIPVPGDYDGDRKTDVAVFRPSTGVWYIVQSSNYAGITYQFGASNDVPVQGDYDGDGRADIALFRPSTGVWYIVKSSNSTGVAYAFGAMDDIPVQGDYDGDGKTDIGLFRPSSGIWYIVVSGNLAGASYLFGGLGDIPVPKHP